MLAAGQVMEQREPLLLDGIDLFVARSATQDEILAALASALGLTPAEIIGPDEDALEKLDVLECPLYATIRRAESGDFGFKVDLDGRMKRDYEALARRFADALGHDVVMPDERAPDPVSSIRLRHGSPDAHGWLDEMEPDGFRFLMPSAPS
jgi:hypothetical protein